MEEGKRTPMTQGLYDLLGDLAAIFIVVTLVFTFVGRLARVDGSSMLPTLHDGDQMVVQSIGYVPKPGDVVVLNRAFSNVEGPIVKRVIAVGGQTVRIDYGAGLVYVDGMPLEETYILEPFWAPPYSNLTEVTVPEGSVFVMGDNRNDSQDSRHVELGAVDSRYLLGRAVIILFPFSDFGPIEGTP